MANFDKISPVQSLRHQILFHFRDESNRIFLPVPFYWQKMGRFQAPWFCRDSLSGRLKSNLIKPADGYHPQPIIMLCANLQSNLVDFDHHNDCDELTESDFWLFWPLATHWHPLFSSYIRQMTIQSPQKHQHHWTNWWKWVPLVSSVMRMIYDGINHSRSKTYLFMTIPYRCLFQVESLFRVLFLWNKVMY